MFILKIKKEFIFLYSIVFISFSFLLNLNVAYAAINTATYDSEIKSFSGISSPVYGSINWTANTPTGTSIKIRVRTGTTNDGSGSSWHAWDDSCNVNNNSSLAINAEGQANPCINDGNQYVQYEAILNTDSGLNVPTLSSLIISTRVEYPTDPSQSWLVSSPFNSSNPYNSIQKISWNADTSGGSVQFQIRSSADGVTWGPWCGPIACSSISNNLTSFATGTGAYYTDSLGGQLINTANSTPLNKNSQYYQYAAFLASNDGTGAPVLQNVTTNYAYNIPPSINNLDYIQNSDGSVTIPYTLSETYDSQGNIQHGTSSSAIKTLLFYQSDILITSPALTNSQTGIITLNNPNNAPLPTQGTMIIDNELMSFDSNGVGANQRNIIARAIEFASSYPTIASSHNSGSAVFFQATKKMGDGNLISSIGGCGDGTCNALAATGFPGATTSTPTLQFNWDAKNDQFLNLDGSKLTGLNFKVVANDADVSGFNNVGSSSSLSSKTLDLQSSKISSISTNASDGAYKIGLTLSLNINFSENINFDSTGEKKIILNLNSGVCTISSSIINSNTATCSYAIGSGDNTPSGQYLKVDSISTNGIIKDQFGNQISDFSIPINQNIDQNGTKQIVIDNIAPAVSAGTDVIFGSQFIQTANVSDGGSGIDSASYQWTKTFGPGNISFENASAIATSVNADADGNYGLQFSVRDKAGNQSISTMNLIWDSIAPNFDDLSDKLANGQFTQSLLNIVENGSGIQSYAWSKVSGPGNIIFGSQDSQSTTIYSDADGTYVIQITARDKAGNLITKKMNITFDMTPPKLLYFYSTSPNSTIDNPTGSGVINIIAKYDESISGILKVNIGPMSAQVNVDLNEQFSPNELAGSFTIGAPKAGYDTTPDPLQIESILSQTVTDIAGNTNDSMPQISSAQNLSSNGSLIFIDTTPPILESFVIEQNGSVRSTGIYKKGDVFTLVANYNKTIQANGNLIVRLNTGSGFHDILLSNSQAGKKIIGTYVVGENENAENLKVQEIVYQKVLDGKGVELTAIGNVLDGTYAQNVGDLIENISGFQIDTTSPILGSSAISYNVSKTNNSTITAMLNAEDNFDLNGGAMLYSMNGGVNWCNPIAYSQSYGFDITSPACGGSSINEIKTITVKFIDKAGNSSQNASTQIEFDNNNPILQKISVDQSDGIYGPGSKIKIIAEYNEQIVDNSHLEIKLNNNVQINLSSVENGNTLFGVYTVGASGTDEDIDILKALTIQSQLVLDTSNPVNVQDSTALSGISENIDNAKKISIDTTAPIATLKLDRSIQEGKVQLLVSPDDRGVIKDGMKAQVQIFGLNQECDFSNIDFQTLTEFPQIFLFNDDLSKVKKACVKLIDKVGNESSVFSTLSPSNPEDFSYTDLTNKNNNFYGSILTWKLPEEEGNGYFKQYDLAWCQSDDSRDCNPMNIVSITNKDQNYKVFNDLDLSKKYCYKVRFEDGAGDVSKYSDTICEVPGEGPIASNADADFQSQPIIADITKTTASVAFKTIDKNNGDLPLATLAVIEVYGDENLSELVKVVSDVFNVTHLLEISDLIQGRRYYLKIKIKDSLEREKELAYDKNFPDKYSFETLGKLSKINLPETEPSIITDSHAVIKFATDQNAKCFIEYKQRSATEYEGLNTKDWESEAKKNHAITIYLPLTETQYDYRVTCSDGSVTVGPVDGQTFMTKKDNESLRENIESLSSAIDNVPAVISNISLADVTGENATITWNTNENANSLVTYEAEGAAFSKMAGDTLVNDQKENFSTFHSVKIDELVPDTKYLFTVVSYDLSGNISQSSQSYFTTKQPSALSSIKVISTALGKAIITWSTGTPASSIVEYGTTLSYGQTKNDSSKTKDHSIILEDLTPGQTYHFRVKGEDGNKNIFASSDITFQPKSPPKIDKFKIDSIREHGAIVSFTTNVPTDSLVIYTDTKDSSNSGFQGKPEVATKHEIQLKNLASGVEFSIKVKVTDEDGNQTEEVFSGFTTTKDTNPPKIDRVKTDAALTQTDKVQAIISWTTDELSDGQIIFKEGRNGEEKTFDVNTTPAFSHVGVITSFKQGIVYYFKVKSKDESGNDSTSSDYALLTPKQKQNIIQIIIGNFTDIFGWAKF